MQSSCLISDVWGITSVKRQLLLRQEAQWPTSLKPPLPMLWLLNGLPKGRDLPFRMNVTHPIFYKLHYLLPVCHRYFRTLSVRLYAEILFAQGYPTIFKRHWRCSSPRFCSRSGSAVVGIRGGPHQESCFLGASAGLCCLLLMVSVWRFAIDHWHLIVVAWSCTVKLPSNLCRFLVYWLSVDNRDSLLHNPEILLAFIMPHLGIFTVQIVILII